VDEDTRAAPRGRLANIPLLRALPDTVVIILVLAGFFDMISGNPIIHGVVLFAAAGAIVGDAIARRGAGQQLRKPAARPRTSLYVVGIMIGYAVVVGEFTRYSWPASIAVAIPAVGAVAYAWRTSPPKRPEAEQVGVFGAIVWASVFIALGVWELAALLLQPTLIIESYDHPTISAVMDPILVSHAARSVFLLLWLAVGWYLVDR